MDPYTVLVVDDDEDLCEILRYNLFNEGYRVDIAYSAEEALLKDIKNYHLVLLDVMLGKISGFKLASILRNRLRTTTPIIFLSARSTENDLLTGFKLGAEDYIAKPFSVREVMARVNAVINRINTKKGENTKVISFEKLNMNLTNKQVIVEGEEIRFTKKEFEILKLLIENKNRIFTREELLTCVWPEEAFVLSRTIDVNITRIRKKIGPYEQNIVTKLGLGYCFET